MKKTVLGITQFIVVLLGFLFLSCATSADIYTDAGVLARPDIIVKKDLKELSLEPFSQNSITELKADLVDNVNLPLLYSLVKSENPELLEKIARVHLAEGYKNQASTLENPELRAQINRIPLTSENSFRDGSYEFRMLQPIDVSGGINADKKKAKALHLKATWELIDAERKIKILSASAFFEYLFRTQLLEHQKILADVRQAQYEIIDDEVAKGKSVKTQLLESHRLLTDAKLRLEDAKLSFAISKNSMKSLIGDFGLVFGEPLFEEDFVMPSLSKENLDEYLKTHPEYLAATQQITAQEAEQLKMNGQHLQKMKVGLGYEFENDGENHWLNLVFEIPFPLWNFGKGNKYAAKAKVYIARKQADAVLIRLYTEIENAFNHLENMQAKLKFVEEFLKEKRSLHEEIVKGQASVTTKFDVLKSQAELSAYEIEAHEIKLALYKTYFFLYISLNSKFPEMK